MRIVFVTNNYTPYSAGVVSSINSAVDALRALGYTVSIITLDFLRKNEGEYNDPPYVLRIPCQIKCTYREKKIAIPFFYHKILSRYIEQLQPDIIHTHHPFLLGPASVRIGNTLSIPVVFTYHTLYEHYTHYVAIPSCVSQWYLQRKLKQFCNGVKGIIAPSSAVKEYIQKKGIKTPVSVIPSGLQSLFVYDEQPVKNRSDNSPLRLLVVSRFEKEKNLIFLLDVVRALSIKYHLTIAGYGQEYNNLCQYAYDDLKLSRQQVAFQVRPSKKDLAALYKNADLFLFSSVTDTQGIVLAEAMAGATPVVALDGPGQRDIIRNGCNGYIVRNKQEMVDTIEHVYQDRQLLCTLQKNAWQIAKQYRSDVLVEKLVCFYEQYTH